MARITFKGLEEYELRLSKAAAGSEEIAKKAVYEGAGIVADAIRKEIEALPIVTGYGTSDKPLPGGVTAVQKRGLLDGLGVSPMSDNAGYIDVKIGFDGYNRTKTEQYPQGQPNQLVARGLESGTSWKQKHPFVRPAVKRSRAAAESAMQKTIDEELKKIME